MLPRVHKIGLIAGSGQLPVHVALNAKRHGIAVIPFMIGRDHQELKQVCQEKGHDIVPGLLGRTLALLQQESITHLVFAGKVNKWILLRDPRVDAMAVNALKQVVRLNDDAVMLWLIEQLQAVGIEVLPQNVFLKDLFLEECVLTSHQPTAEQLRDAAYGFDMAKEMGRLDIGQSIVVHSGMIIAVEAIEGTDDCIQRAGKLTGKKGGLLVKVAKPNQDQRFDIPTVGLNTLKSMHKAGLSALVTEAGQTLYLDPKEMTAFANRHRMLILSTRSSCLPALGIADDTPVQDG
jgi:UDP-2,3-diacylglucosamine hydrolase